MRKHRIYRMTALLLLFTMLGLLLPARASAASRPARVKGVTAVVNSGTWVTLTWKKVKNATVYIIYRKIVSAPDTTAGTTDPNVTTAAGFEKLAVVGAAKKAVCQDTELSAGSTCSYYVKAYRKVGRKTLCGKASAVVTVTTDTVPALVEENIYKTYEDSDGFCIKDGILYAYLGSAKEITIPADVKEIYPDALSGDFGHGVNLEKVTVPGTVEKIDSEAFAFTEADYIYLKDGIQVLGDNVFMDSYIKEVHFPGSLTKIGQCILETEEGLWGTKIYVTKGSLAEKYFKAGMPYGKAKLITE